MIISNKKYDGLVKVLDLLSYLNVPKADEMRSATIETWSCGSCTEFIDDCNCDMDESRHGRYYAEYDDEASFE